MADTVTDAVARLDSMALAEAAATACWQAQLTEAMAEDAACIKRVVSDATCSGHVEKEQAPDVSSWGSAWTAVPAWRHGRVLHFRASC